MDAGAYADIKNSIGKTAVEMAALVGSFFYINFFHFFRY